LYYPETKIISLPLIKDKAESTSSPYLDKHREEHKESNGSEHSFPESMFIRMVGQVRLIIDPQQSQRKCHSTTQSAIALKPTQNEQ
jgi:hypothetical protein